MGDMLYNFTEWLRSTSLTEFSLWIADTSLSNLIVTNFWAIPVIQVFHILALAGAFGAVFMITLRVFGLAGMNRTLAETEARYVRWIWWGGLVMLLSGIGLIIGEPIRELINPIFWIKMVLVIVAIFVSLSFHGRVMKRLATGGEVTGGIKAASLAIVVLWCAIMFCGRWIAYAPV
ncbi:hypothetical protein [Tsuneonella sp. HG222]